MGDERKFSNDDASDVGALSQLADVGFALVAIADEPDAVGWAALVDAWALDGVGG